MHLVHDPAAPPAAIIGFDEFLAVDIRAGTVLAAAPVPAMRHPSLRLEIDFGPGVGVRVSAARIAHYAPETLVGRRVLAVVNFAARQIGPVRSEVLVLGVPDADGAIVLVGPDAAAPNGARLA